MYGNKQRQDISIVMADDHPIFLDAVASILAVETDFKILARCASGEAAIFAVRKHHPDILLLDNQMPDLNTLDVLGSIKAQNPRVRTVLMAEISEECQIAEAISLGAAGIFLKEMGSQLLIQCIRAVHSGQRWFDRAAAGRAMNNLNEWHKIGPVRLRPSLLTRRETEIAWLVAQGLRNREIARKLFISEGTVKVHLHNVSDKLKLHGRYDLATYARDKGLA
jgi:DNA-binding NarL/FixJ family response regulator